MNWIAAGGTLLLIAGLITIPVLSISLAARAYVTTLKQLMWAIPTVVTVLALVHVMNESGQTITLGAGLRAGGIFAFIGPMIGWLGVGVTGSDRS